MHYNAKTRCSSNSGSAASTACKDFVQKNVDCTGTAIKSVPHSPGRPSFMHRFQSCKCDGKLFDVLIVLPHLR